MSYCSHCGVQLIKSGEVCEHCGKRLGLVSEDGVTDERSPQQRQSDAVRDAILQEISFCSHCGLVVPKGQFCSHCGASVSAGGAHEHKH